VFFVVQPNGGNPISFKEKTMPLAVALATDLATGVVISLPQAPTLAIEEVCNSPECHAKIEAFQGKKLSQREREKAMKHYKRCGPCRDELGWGRL
jgi:hypothetical protein